MKKKVWDITVKDNPNRVVMGENDEFYTTDTEAYLVFKLEDKNFNPATAVLTLENRNDGSLKNETVDVVDGLIEWEMPQRYIEHFGNWQGQLVYEDTKDGQPELYTSATFTFVVNAHIGDKKKPSLVEIENWEKFIRDGTELIETWEDMEDLRQANEAQRQANYQELLDTGVLQTNINTKLEQLEEEYAPKLTEVTAQLAQKVKFEIERKYALQKNENDYFRIPFMTVTNAGTIIAGGDKRDGGNSDFTNINIAISRSTDNGKSFGEPFEIIEHDNLNANSRVMDGCVIYDDVTNTIYVFAVKLNSSDAWYNNNNNDWDVVYVKSTDDGITWTTPVSVKSAISGFADRWKFITGVGNGIRMSNGTLVLPIQVSKPNSAIYSSLLYSTDGVTWTMGQSTLPKRSSECNVVEIESGKLLLNARSFGNSHRRHIYVTSDLGTEWEQHRTNQKINEVLGIGCMGSTTKFKHNNQDYIVYSAPLDYHMPRKDLGLQVLNENGTEWNTIATYQNGEVDGYSCLASYDNNLYVLYEEDGSLVFGNLNPYIEGIIEGKYNSTDAQNTNLVGMTASGKYLKLCDISLKDNGIVHSTSDIRVSFVGADSVTDSCELRVNIRRKSAFNVNTNADFRIIPLTGKVPSGLILMTYTNATEMLSIYFYSTSELLSRNVFVTPVTGLSAKGINEFVYVPTHRNTEVDMWNGADSIISDSQRHPHYSPTPSLATITDTIYVDAVNGNDTNDGAQTKPIKTMTEALTRIPNPLNYEVIIKIVSDMTDNIIINNFDGIGMLTIESVDTALKNVGYIFGEKNNISIKLNYLKPIAGYRDNTPTFKSLTTPRPGRLQFNRQKGDLWIRYCAVSEETINSGYFGMRFSHCNDVHLDNNTNANFDYGVLAEHTNLSGLATTFTNCNYLYRNIFSRILIGTNDVGTGNTGRISNYMGVTYSNGTAI